MQDINSVILVARLVRDAEIKYTNTGYAILNFSVASNRSVKRNDTWEDEVSFFNCTLFGKRAESLAQYLIKGKQPKHRKIKKIEYQKKRRLKYPEQYKARTAVGNALRDRRLIKKPCGVCGNMKSEAHHADYSRYLEVQWFCQECHKAYHKEKCA